MPDRFEIHQPLDMHLHLRDGAMLQLVAHHSTQDLAGAVIMPNLVPPITDAAMLRAYRDRIQATNAQPAGFLPLMTLFFKNYTEVELAEAKAAGLFAIKLYPQGVTTNSEGGVSSIAAGDPVFRMMEEMGIPLLVHGETTGFVMDRENEFLSVYAWLAEKYPRLKITMEHITTKEALGLLDRFPNLSATVTLHHLIITLDDVAGGLLRPHLFCKPIAKRPEDRDALLAAVLAGHPRIMLGSDSAPHPRSAKESCGCAAGVYSAPVLLARTVQLFDENAALDRVQAFVSTNAIQWHGLSQLPKKSVSFIKQDWTVPAQFQNESGTELVVPYEAGKTLPWKVDAIRVSAYPDQGVA